MSIIRRKSVYAAINFINWTSGNDDIDKLIQECQIKAYVPYKIIEWVPYDNLKHIKYLTRGGFSEIYTASWIDGGYEEWDPKEQRLLSWFEEAKSHLTISNKLEDIVSCYGLTKDPSNGNYMLVIRKMNFDLRKYLQRNHKKPTWKERIRIIYEISNSLYFIHGENAIHKDLHSGNILYSQIDGTWVIGDLGFCGPADKSSKSIYGNLPYIAPEVIAGKGEIYRLYQNKPDEIMFQPNVDGNNLEMNETNINYTSKSRVYQFENFPEPRNATKVFYDNSKIINYPKNLIKLQGFQESDCND
ncbi:kinase-like domain-containing protein [Rhizophagus clarus]|uniref:Kinase-like domain-containing protein n=1 Tax=Rhizophagus clarus TaxID=94130 RepID=A0A8H3QGM7_9GLOM|nr:kinase-like domain-containing protein [Rhizophagus clarus]